MSCKTKIEKCLNDLAVEARELYLDRTIPHVDGPQNPLKFYRSFVAPNKPVVVNNAIDHWPALKKWNDDYLRKKIGDKEVTVAVTPNGYADAVTDGKFVMPEERMMKFKEFLDIIETPAIKPGVFYVQKQNSNLIDEFVSIMDDVESDIAWGTEAFGKPPDAVNFWMGDSRAVTSRWTINQRHVLSVQEMDIQCITLHRDHYENLYCVIKGWKKFILHPPTDLPFVPYENYQTAVFKESNNGEFMIVDDTGQVPWVAVDPLRPDLKTYPQYDKASSIEVTVHAGQMLYLPSLWFHHVQQSHGCIAVNYWYDMEFDIKYNYYKCVEGLVDIIKDI